MSTASERRRQLAAERQRTYRQRRQDGCVVVRVLVCEETIGTLEDLGLLAEFEDDAGEIANAVEDALKVMRDALHEGR